MLENVRNIDLLPDTKTAKGNQNQIENLDCIWSQFIRFRLHSSPWILTLLQTIWMHWSKRSRTNCLTLSELINQLVEGKFRSFQESVHSKSVSRRNSLGYLRKTVLTHFWSEATCVGTTLENKWTLLSWL